MTREEQFISIGNKSGFNNKCRACGNTPTRVEEKFNYAWCIDCFDMSYRWRKFLNELIKVERKFNNR